MGVRPLVAGNWKMNGLETSLAELTALGKKLKDEPIDEADIMICPPSTLIARAHDMLAGTAIALGGQDCHAAESGAHTGDISAEMLADAGADAVIVGHSERRADHGETDALIAEKAAAAHRAGLVAIICVGETEQERRDGITLAIIGKQLEGSLPDDIDAEDTVIAYEPVWAIGTGLTPTPEDVAEVHRFIRGHLTEKLGESGESVRILYGGSVKPSNAAELLAVPDVNGALVGGASLKADDFYGILATYGKNS
ncbi:triose-phosphate isomerase [Methyloligella halotolerans]|nr:triose-phosphate isomerase [Methyloligella halotolerans]